MISIVTAYFNRKILFYNTLLRLQTSTIKDFEVIAVTISPDLVKDGDVEMIQDLTVAALNEAKRKVEESLKGKLGGMLPPGLM